MNIDTDFYTDISLVVGIVSICLVPLFTLMNILPTTRASLAAFAVVNASVVNVMGAFINYYGNINTDFRTLNYTNAYRHALPAFVATAVLLLWNKLVHHKPNIPIALAIGAIALIVYFIIPNRRHEIGLRKVQNSYGLSSRQVVLWFGIFILIESLLLICMGLK